MGTLRERMQQDLTLRGLSPATHEAYLRQARAFVAHFRRDASKLGTEHVRAWVLHLLTDLGRSPASVNLAIAALRFLFGTTLKRPDVMQGIRNVRMNHGCPEVPSGREVELLLAATPGLRHRAMFMLLYSAGLRVSELVKLCPSDVERRRMVIVVRETKTRRDRLVPLAPRMLEVLRAYWRSFRPSGPYLFPGLCEGKPVTRDAVALALHNAAARAGLGKHFYPHLLRHAFATHMLELGADIRSVQILLGHTSIRSTARYLQLTEARRSTLKNPLEVLGREEGRSLG